MKRSKRQNETSTGTRHRHESRGKQAEMGGEGRGHGGDDRSVRSRCGRHGVDGGRRTESSSKKMETEQPTSQLCSSGRIGLDFFLVQHTENNDKVIPDLKPLLADC